MKNKTLSYIVVIALVFLSFFGGSYYEKQKIKTQSTFPTETSTNVSPITVTEVNDGDTLKLSDGKTFRLYGVNAPEVKEPFFEEAKAFTENLVLGKEISFEQEENYKVDKFGRTLGYAFVDGVNLNVELVRNGLARVVFYEKRAKIKFQDELLSAEKEAKEKKLGVWKN